MRSSFHSHPCGQTTLSSCRSAIVENQTDNDWNNVQLSLVSGRPISFVEDLYMPLYIPRPVVEPELYASLRPHAYAEGMPESEMAKAPAGAFNRAATDELSAQLGAPQQHIRQCKE